MILTTIQQGGRNSKKKRQTKVDSVIDKEEMWAMIGQLRGTMNAVQYKHAVLGLIFVKYVCDSKLNLIPNEHRAKNIFCVPSEGEWANIIAHKHQRNTIGGIIDRVMTAIERENPVIMDVLPKNYARLLQSKTDLGKIIDLIDNIQVDAENNLTLLGAYEYFLSKFAKSDGKRGGEFYTPHNVAKLVVTMLQPDHGHIYDPCCGYSRMLVESVEFIKASKDKNKIKTTSVYGQESNYIAWQFAKMSLAMQNIDTSQIIHGDSSLDNDQYPDLKADFILSNPTSSILDWNNEPLPDDKRWIYGVPPKNHANFAWIQHIVHHLTPTGKAVVVLENGSMSSHQLGEDLIRKNLVQANLVDCIVSLPGQLLYSTQIPVCLWILSKNRIHYGQRDEVLFIDARRMGNAIDHIHRDLTNQNIIQISSTYRSWCEDEDEAGNVQSTEYSDMPGFCKSVTLNEIYKNEYILTPWSYVGDGTQLDHEESSQERMEHLVLEWHKLQAKSNKLDAVIAKNIQDLGFNVKNDES